MKLSVKRIFIIFTVFFILLSTVYVAVELGSYRKYRFYIREVCEQRGVEEELVFAVVRTESSFNENALSRKGAVGLMQLMPSTAEFIAKKVGFNGELNLKDGKTNLYLGICYLEYLFKRYGDERLVLACYNAGEGTVSRWTDSERESIPYKETREYIKKVKRRKIFYKVFT